ncbi:protocadherin alpha-3-like [Solea solea]|uniref:protocadherin alpha-3-like n=1 Tax=Solea solea TaxID=90069 RepID=UPI00272C8050|nr:protocadherin alpha-3-like [Solea solea]
MALKRFDFETLKTFQFHVVASDSGTPSLSSNVTVNVFILDQNDNAPVILYPVSSNGSAEGVEEIPRNVNAGYVVTKVRAYDADIGYNGWLLFSLQEVTEHSLFTLDRYTGQIKTLRPFTETDEAEHKLVILVKDNGNISLSATATVIVKVVEPKEAFAASDVKNSGTPSLSSNVTVNVFILDQNDNAPVILYPVSSNGSAQGVEEIPRNVNAGYVVTKVRAYDADIGYNVHKAGERVSAELVLQKALDREKQPVITMTLTAVDGGNPPKSGTSQLTINVLDNNDNIPIFSESLYKTKIPENTPVGTTVMAVNATDADEGLNGEIVFSLRSKDQDRVLDIFEIESQTGVIKVKGNIDFEERKAFEIRVEASDKGQPPMSAHCKVLVEVIDLNDNAPDITVTSLLNTVKEDSNVGTVVALVSIVDKDGGKNGEVNVHIKNEVPFKLETNYKNYYSLLVDGPLDRETVSNYNVTIVATDKGAPPLTSTSVVYLRVSDVNDNAPWFANPFINVYVNENSPVGAIIKTVIATDADINQNSQVTYSLLQTNSANSDLLPFSTMVNINSETGDIITLQSFNFEELKTLQFKVQATDSGVPPLSSNVTVNVFILDENDNSPVVLAPYSEHGSVNSESIPYNVEAGHIVAKIRAVDADSGYNALLSYHLSEPKGNNLFRIGTSTGEIKTKRRMSDNDLKTHPLVVLVSDNGEPSLSATVSIEVMVVESSADIQTQFRHVPIKDESFTSLNLYLLIAIVSVSAIFLLSLISLIAVKCHRTDSSFSRYSAPMITTHPDGSWSYSKATQQYDVCFSSDTLKSDVVVFPAPYPPVDAELISINGGDTFTRTQTLPSNEKVSKHIKRYVV